MRLPTLPPQWLPILAKEEARQDFGGGSAPTEKKTRKTAKRPCSPRGNREIKRTQTRLLTGRQQIENF